MSYDISCESCSNPIEQERIEAYIDLGMGRPTECKTCASKKAKPMAFMGPEGKTGVGHINVVDPEDKRTLEDVKRWHKRGAQHCTAG